MRPLVALTFVAALAACDSAADSFFDEPRVYAFDLVEAQTGTPAETEAECAAAQPDPDAYVNCWQTLTLCPSGRAELLVTDIINSGRYEAQGSTLSLFFNEGSTEVGPSATFGLADDRRSAVFSVTGDRWTLWDRHDVRAESAATACVPGGEQTTAAFGTPA